ncbi:glycosyltransferase [Aequorivita sublithincola DSM 14238]|uniref:Glycosyltransferase n=1 Tax=Aequorivita sublithincola (strain DSM 14238 / LMG 21431 / ACAM 643 / 9-3) TaxID=746697 RepID=I3YXJ4_AEQSU|nr:glycosyltransferase family 4 protein [Aequorivita sublithincola]AFL81712.1 glycosyltransferase [Aequorivita sublithincola DSM 14238]
MTTKILILTSEFPPQPGGIGNHAYNLAKGLQGNGFEVKLVCDTRSTNGDAEKLFDKNLSFEVVRIPRQKIIFISYLNRIKTAFSLTSKSEMIICSGKFSLWLGAFLSFFFKRKFIAIIHGSEIQLPITVLRKLTDLSLKRFDKIIAVSNYTKSLVSHLNLNSIEVIPNGFEIKQPESLPSKSNPVPVLITVGNVTQRKGQHNVINALPILLKKYPDLKYHIVGIPTERAKLGQLALHLGVEKAVVFFGKVSEEEKMKLLQQADVFVMLSETTNTGDVEGFGIAILEANAFGVPAIGALGCGIEDAVNEGISGRLINNKDSKQFLKSLEEILNNYEFYSKRARGWSEGFTWEKVMSSYLKVLKEPRNKKILTAKDIKKAQSR